MKSGAELKDFIIGIIIMVAVILVAFAVSGNEQSAVTNSCNTNGTAGGLGC